MNRNELRNRTFMEIAEKISQLSHAKRKKVGCIIVSHENKVISMGYNGTPRGTDNACEDDDNRTYDWVLHAESNAIDNSLTREFQGGKVYVTLSPCSSCAARIIQQGFAEVYFKEIYRNTDGIQYLRNNGVKCQQIP